MKVQTKRSNRLINEKSPYLLQHAYNPVDWYPWGGKKHLKKQRRRIGPYFYPSDILHAIGENLVCGK